MEALYDADTLAARSTPGRHGRPGWSGRGPRAVAVEGRPGWRGLTAGVALNAMVLGVGDALGEGPEHEAIVELRRRRRRGRARPVTFVMVPGAPRASRLIVRPWLLAG